MKNTVMARIAFAGALACLSTVALAIDPYEPDDSSGFTRLVLIHGPHTCGFGLAAKIVALEPSTGFSLDTPCHERPSD